MPQEQTTQWPPYALTKLVYEQMKSAETLSFPINLDDLTAAMVAITGVAEIKFRPSFVPAPLKRVRALFELYHGAHDATLAALKRVVIIYDASLDRPEHYCEKRFILCKEICQTYFATAKGFEWARTATTVAAIDLLETWVRATRGWLPNGSPAHDAERYAALAAAEILVPYAAREDAHKHYKKKHISAERMAQDYEIAPQVLEQMLSDQWHNHRNNDR